MTLARLPRECLPPSPEIERRLSNSGRFFPSVSTVLCALSTRGTLRDNHTHDIDHNIFQRPVCCDP